MPPKERKSNTPRAASWFHCEKCDIYITSKDRELHSKDCTGKTAPDGSWEYAHIASGVLYTYGVQKRNFVVSELQDLPEKSLNQLLFVSEGAIELAKFRIGELVCVESFLDGTKLPPLIRLLWPIPEKYLTSIYVSDRDCDLNWFEKKSQPLKVQTLRNACIRPVKTIYLQQRPIGNSKIPLTELQIKEMQRLLRYELKNLVFTEGSIIPYNFYNKDVEFEVTRWTEFANEESMEDAMQNLNIGRRYCKVTNETNFEISFKPISDTDTDAVQQKDGITKADIGGLDEQMRVIEEAMFFALGLKTAPKGIKLSRALLLYGYTGCGKTMICDAMCTIVKQQSCESLKPLVIKLNIGELFSKFLGETEQNLSGHFERAFAHYPQPTLIVVEDVHILCPKVEANDITKRVAASFASMLDTLNCRREAQRIFLLATTSHVDKVHMMVRRCGRLDCEVEIGTPTPKDRLDILQCLLRHVEHRISPTELSDVADITHGYVGADLANLVNNASMLALKAADGGRAVYVEDINASLVRVKPSAMREVCIENPKVYWSDIGGQTELKLKLQQAIEWPLLYPEKFQRMGIKPPRGILMYGPPGCSKTMIAKALATESHLNFLSIKGPELFSMWVGESERAVREVFRKARQVSPAIVFFDEIDAIGGERSESGSTGSGSSVKERVLTQLLTELDGVEALENVTIVAATNRPDMIDKALLRPGRFDRIIYVGLPDEYARREIFRIKLLTMPLANDVHIDELVARTAGYSGAEIQAVCHEAALKTLEESFDAQQVEWQHFEYALQVVQPRTSADLLQLYEEYKKKS